MMLWVAAVVLYLALRRYRTRRENLQWHSGLYSVSAEHVCTWYQVCSMYWPGATYDEYQGPALLIGTTGTDSVGYHVQQAETRHITRRVYY